ncbi:transcriptional regulator, TetR family [Sphingobium sp. AP50]|nr:transcriptional regulator, TetR family [Sphingobium sp. AP50]
MTERGYSSASVDSILSAADVPKGSFYHYFRDKADFGLALIDAYDAFFVGLLSRSFEDSALAPIDRLRHFTREAEAGMARHDFRRGCLVGNLGQEMGALPEPFRVRLTSVLQGWQRRTAKVLRAAQATGAMATHHDPDALAVFFWIGWEGAVLRAKLERNAGPLALFATHFFELIETVTE